MKNLLYLLRHAHIDSKGTLIGQTDIPLSDRGKEQAKYWQKKMQDTNFEAVWISPLQRAIETADIILENHKHNVAVAAKIEASARTISVKIIPAFTEISLGSWEGKTKAWVQENDSKRWIERGENMEYIAPPLGENFANLHARVMPAFFDICQQAKKHPFSLLIAHQAVNRVILSHVLRTPLSNMQNIIQDYACLNVLDVTDELRFINYEPCAM